LYGDKQALLSVADCFYFGVGVTKDVDAAEVWYRNAEVNGVVFD
jgi:TPR repeat protein